MFLPRAYVHEIDRMIYPEKNTYQHMEAYYKELNTISELDYDIVEMFSDGSQDADNTTIYAGDIVSLSYPLFEDKEDFSTKVVTDHLVVTCEYGQFMLRSKTINMPLHFAVHGDKEVYVLRVVDNVYSNSNDFKNLKNLVDD